MRSWLSVAASLALFGCSLIVDVDSHLCPKADPNCEGSGGTAGSTASDDGSTVEPSTDAAAPVMDAKVLAKDGSDTPMGADAAACDDCLLRVEYLNRETGVDPVDRIRPRFLIVNQSTTAFALEEITIRYFFTAEFGGTQSYTCSDVDSVGQNCDWVVSSNDVWNADAAGADRYIEIGFTAAAGELGKLRTIDVNGIIRQDDNKDFYQDDDYSFGRDVITFTPWPHVTAYRNGELVWGVEPR